MILCHYYFKNFKKNPQKFFFSGDLLKYGKASKRLHRRLILETIRFKVVR